MLSAVLRAHILGLFVRVYKVPLQRLPAVLVIFWLHFLAGLETPFRDANHVSTKALSANTKFRKEVMVGIELTFQT
jgi:hypothetical protein